MLFLFDPWDEFMMEHLHAFDGKTLRLAEKKDLKSQLAQKRGRHVRGGRQVTFRNG